MAAKSNSLWLLLTTAGAKRRAVLLPPSPALHLLPHASKYGGGERSQEDRSFTGNRS